MRKQLVNTGVSELPAVRLRAEAIQKEERAGALAALLNKQRLVACYSDGSKKSYRIRFREDDIAKIGAQGAGVYEVRGMAVFPEYPEILIEQRADPYVIRADGWYYFTASYPVCGMRENEQGVGYDRIVLRRARSIGELAAAKEVTIWHQKDSKKAFRFIWAPELHCINGKWCILFTAGTSADNVWGIRPHLLECKGGDLMNPASWGTDENLHRMEALPEEMTAFRHFSLDMTYFEHNGRHYVVWAEVPEQDSNLYIAEIDPGEPWRLKSAAVQISAPEYDWERRGGVQVNEGPAVLFHGKKVYLAFSASAVDYNYCVGMLEAPADANLLDASSWKKHSEPLLMSSDFTNQCGPGHNSFTTDENGNVVLVYHARPYECSNAQDASGHYGDCGYTKPGEHGLSDPCRHARAKSVNFAADGTPVLHLAPCEELLDAYRDVVLHVIVEA